MNKAPAQWVYYFTVFWKDHEFFRCFVTNNCTKTTGTCVLIDSDQIHRDHCGELIIETPDSGPVAAEIVIHITHNSTGGVRWWAPDLEMVIHECGEHRVEAITVAELLTIGASS